MGRGPLAFSSVLASQSSTLFSTNRNASFTARATGAPEARQAERATAQAELADRCSPGERAERVTGAPKARQAERAPAQAEHEAIKYVTS